MKPKATKPDWKDQERCLELRCQAKRGVRLQPEEMKFLEKLCFKYPEWYGSLNQEIFNRTKPFGA